MGDLPDDKFNIPCHPYLNICLDLMGLCEVSAMNNSRSKLKTWPILFCCANTGALAIYVASAASTQAFLVHTEWFVADHGTPKTVYSDRGSNLTKATTFVANSEPNKWNLDELAKTAAVQGRPIGGKGQGSKEEPGAHSGWRGAQLH